MGDWVFDLLQNIFGKNSVMESVIEAAFTALKSQFTTGGIITKSMGIFAAIGCSLMIIYFFMNLYDSASKDLLTLEKLIVSFIKLIAAFTLMLCLTTIMNGFVTMGEGFYEISRDNVATIVSGAGNSDGVQYQTDGGSSVAIASDDFENQKDAIIDEYSGWKGVKNHIGLILKGLLPMLIMWIANLVVLFLVVANMIQIIVRGICSPIAVVQLFDEGMRSSGIKYMKKFASLCFTFALFILINAATNLAAASLASAMSGGGGLSEAIMNGSTPITEDTINSVLTMKTMAIYSLVKVAGVGAMIGAGRISDEVWGA